MVSSVSETSRSFFDSVRASGPTLLVICLIFVGSVYAYQRYAGTSATFRYIEVGTQRVRVDVADTELLRAKGLSGRERLKPYEGMLFVFPEEGNPGFWMKDMQFPIDIAWLSTDGRIVHMVQVLSPDTYPTVFKSPNPARFVLELPAGFFETHRIKEGDFVHF